jgi:hypothetical protein
MFRRPDSGECVRNDHFCIVSALFLPWSHDQPLQKPNAVSWEDYFSSKKPGVTVRLLRYIENLGLMHKSKEEACIDQLRLHALQGEGENADPFSTHLDMMGVDKEENNNNFDTDENNTISLAVVQSALENSL